MELIVGGRSCGKTAKCIEWVMQDNLPTKSYPFWQKVILCVTTQEADRLRGLVRRKARSDGWGDRLVGLTYNMVYAADEWQRVQLGCEPVELRIDNADMFLQNMFRGQLRGVTWTAREGQVEDTIQILNDRGKGKGWAL